MRLFAVALFVLAFSGCLDIDSPDGALKCSDVPKRACPEGFYCLATSNTCWRYGHFPEDMAEPGQFNPGGPPEDMSIPVEDDMTLDDAGATIDDLATPNDLSQTD